MASFFGDMLPDEKLLPSEWIEKNIFLSKGESPEPGKIRLSRTPYIEGMIDVLAPDSPYIGAVWQKSSQIACSTGAYGLTGYWADYKPASIAIAMPGNGVLKRASRNRIQPMIDNSPALSKKFSQKKSRDSANSVKEKSFTGGTLYLISAKANDDLASFTARYAISDEYSRFPADLAGEGHPSLLIDARLQTYGDKARHLKLSTPTIKGECHVSNDYEETDKRKYFMHCPHCREKIDFEFKYLKWDRDDEGNHLPETVYYECKHCEGKIYEKKHKTKMMSKKDGAKWIATEPNPIRKDIAGFYINALYSPVGWKSWLSIVRDWLKAYKDENKRIGFYNLILGLPYELENKDAPDIIKIYNRREGYLRGTVPKEAEDAILLGGIDVQKDRLEITVRAVKLKEDGTLENWIIDHRAFLGDTVLSHPLKKYYFDPVSGHKSLTPWHKLYKYLITPLKTESGGQKVISSSAIDSGDKPHRVYLFSKRFPGRDCTCN